MTADPLTPAEAVAIAAVIEAHPTREKHWLRWVQKLRAIANEGTPVEPEIERVDARIGGIKQAPNGVLGGPPVQGSNPSGGAMHMLPEGEA